MCSECVSCSVLSATILVFVSYRMAPFFYHWSWYYYVCRFFWRVVHMYLWYYT
jgi:hypothetical protein